jgi:2-polyprenyl-3-methyl-5-hydroxy-6-metoxy-1,4-benzoquinol methylase
MTEDVWDRYWQTTDSSDALKRVAAEERSLRFRRLTEALHRRVGPLEGKRFVELGAGAGTTSISYARRGANVTLVDRSDPALTAAEEAFAAANCDATIMKADLFAPPDEIAGSFDVAMSFGVAEHFAGPERLRVIAAHLAWLKPGGTAVVSVPNSLCPTYRVWKWWLERTDRWIFGFEQPFSPLELRQHARAAGGETVEILAGSAIGDLGRFATPMLVHRLTGGRARLPDVHVRSPADGMLAYVLVAVFARPHE